MLPILAAIIQWGGSGESYCLIQDATQPGAVAEVVFRNEVVPIDNYVTFSLDLNGLSVTVQIINGPNANPDEIIVTPPKGYIAIPPAAVVNDGETQTILIYPDSAVGA